MSRIAKAAALAAAFALSPFASQAQADGAAHYSITISGYVPVVCRATLNQTMVNGGEGIVDLGDLQEFCNDAGGYQVWVDTAPGQSAMLYVDGEKVPLSAGGATLISSSSGAAVRTRHLVLDTGSETAGAPTSLSIRVVAL